MAQANKRSIMVDTVTDNTRATIKRLAKHFQIEPLSGCAVQWDLTGSKVMSSTVKDGLPSIHFNATSIFDLDAVLQTTIPDVVSSLVAKISKTTKAEALAFLNAK